MKGGRADLVKKSTQTGKIQRASTGEPADTELKLIVALGVNEGVLVRTAVPSLEIHSEHACASVSQRTSLKSYEHVNLSVHASQTMRCKPTSTEPAS